MHILVTGAAGFIGSTFVRWLLPERDDVVVTVLDKLTYAGNLANLAPVQDHPRFRFVEGDIADAELVDELVGTQRFDGILNFAAETHVDRSLLEPGAFIQTDVFGTYVLLEAARAHGVPRYLQVSTDEVYGEIDQGSFRETDPIAPRSPYSASKAGGDLMVNAYRTSYGLPTLICRGSNNYGPNQYPEKFIPLFITNAIDDQSLPLYGDGRQVREWIFAEDFSRGIWTVFERGTPGETYNIGSGNERENIDVARQMLDLLGKPTSLITSVTDRPGHDRRYSVDSSRVRALGWQPRMPFEAGLAATVAWYRDNEPWWRRIKSGEFADYYARNYRDRGASSL